MGRGGGELREGRGRGAGELWTVNPVAVNAVDVFTENKRNVTYLESRRGWQMAYINGE